MDIKEEEFELKEEELIIKDEYVPDPEPGCTSVPSSSEILLRTSKIQEYEACNKSSYQQQKYVCPFCVYKTNTEDSFSIHLNIHVETYVCDWCDYVATNKNTLKHHMFLHSINVHKQTRPRYRLQQTVVQCEQCKYKTTSKYHLEKHMVVHIKKPLQCEHCDYNTLRKNCLKRHLIRTHSMCHIGKSQFRNKSLFEAHLLIHNRKRLGNQGGDTSFLDHSIVPDECIVFNSTDFLND